MYFDSLEIVFEEKEYEVEWDGKIIQNLTTSHITKKNRILKQKKMFNLLFNKFFIIMKKISAKLINLSCLEGAADPKNLEGGNAYFFYTLQWWPTCRKQTQITNEWCIFICRSNFINSLDIK